MTARLWWLIQKDFVCEYRGCRGWPRMVVLGIMVAFVLVYQLAMPPDIRQQAAASLGWLSICLASVMTAGHAVDQEHADGCWDALLLYPVSPGTVYLGKLAGNAMSLALLQFVVLPFFSLVCHTPWLDHPAKLVTVSLLGNLGITSVGTLLGAISSSLRASHGLTVLLLLPLLLPVLLGASEATRLIGDNRLSTNWWAWVQLLGAFATVYITAGCLLFEFIVED